MISNLIMMKISHYHYSI